MSILNMTHTLKLSRYVTLHNNNYNLVRTYFCHKSGVLTVSMWLLVGVGYCEEGIGHVVVIL